MSLLREIAKEALKQGLAGAIGGFILFTMAVIAVNVYNWVAVL